MGPDEALVCKVFVLVLILAAMGLFCAVVWLNDQIDAVWGKLSRSNDVLRADLDLMRRETVRRERMAAEVRAVLADRIDELEYAREQQIQALRGTLEEAEDDEDNEDDEEIL